MDSAVSLLSIDYLILRRSGSERGMDCGIEEGRGGWGRDEKNKEEMDVNLGLKRDERNLLKWE